MSYLKEIDELYEKRWKEAQNILSKPLMGVIIQKIQDSYIYDYSYVAETRQFQNRLYFYPISQSEMSKNKALVNNPGW